MAADSNEPDRIQAPRTFGHTDDLEIRGDLASTYVDVFTPVALAALAALAHFEVDRKEFMEARIERRVDRARNRQRITFLDPDTRIPRAQITVREAREGAFVGSEIPPDLRRDFDAVSGPGVSADCPLFDADEDLHVDMIDFGALQIAFTG